MGVNSIPTNSLFRLILLFTLLHFTLSFELYSKQIYLLDGTNSYNPDITYTFDPETPGEPGGRIGAVSWFDTRTGSTWLFGGIAPGNNYGNDIWELKAGYWYRRIGSALKNNQGSYINVNVTGGSPGCRASPSFWIDSQGSFWVFGGESILNDTVVIPTNDMWRFNTTARTWTWMAGNRPSQYLTPISGAPASRSHAASWIYQNKFYLFGGKLAGNITANDLWVFDPQTRAWTLLNDSQPALNQSPGGYPGPRSGAAVAVDSTYVWLFGGRVNNTRFINDMWKYDMATSNWEWMKMSTSESGSYPNTAGAEGNPPAREGACAWVDLQGFFWIYGGFRRNESGAAFYYGDFWKTANTSFIWEGTSSVVEFPAAYNLSGAPGPRAYAAYWMNGGGDMFLMDGLTASGSRDDMWVIDMNECDLDNGGCVTNCSNQVAAPYQCAPCPIGSIGDPKTNCTIYNECLINNGGCDPLVNCTPGITIGDQRTCGACPYGYTGDGESGCVDINECAVNNGGCDILTNCTNNAGAKPTCGPCPNYYAAFGNTCVDIDECADGTANCPLLTICTNKIGAPASCDCPSGFTGLTSCSRDGRKISAGLIAGVTIGGFAVLLIVIGLIFHFTKDKAKQNSSSSRLSAPPDKKFELTALSNA